jgi:transcriptional regulator with XRE-family HTH domain
MKSQDYRWTIRELAVAARTSVTNLLAEAGVSRATVARWAKDQAKPRASTIRRINSAAERLRERAKG